MDALLRRRAMIAAGGTTPPTPPPYTPVEYIVTDGACYIDTRMYAAPPKATEIKVLLGDNVSCALIAGFLVSSGGDARQFAPARYSSTSKTIAISFYHNYVGTSDGMPVIDYSIDNDKPFIVKTDMKKGAQNVFVKQENSDSWITASKTNNNNVNTTNYNLRIFCAYRNNTNELFAPAGSRLYYCRIWSDETYTTLVRDFVPCLYEGEYGLWDNVSNSFFGNAGSGTFSGPSNS